MVRIDAKGLHYKVLNDRIHEVIRSGEEEIVLYNVHGQRYIGTGLKGENIRIEIDGIPGNDLGAFMDGPTIVVNSNCQDGIGNTMNSGRIIVHGNCGDIAGFSMRGGQIYVKGDAGYRVGIHMKSYGDNRPVIVVGGVTRNFLGEYMAGGLLIVLGLEKNSVEKMADDFIGTGMHGGEIFIRREILKYSFGEKKEYLPPMEEDILKIKPYIQEFCELFGYDYEKIISYEFLRLKPSTHRPYGKLYVY